MFRWQHVTIGRCCAVATAIGLLFAAHACTSRSVEEDVPVAALDVASDSYDIVDTPQSTDTRADDLDQTADVPGTDDVVDDGWVQSPCPAQYPIHEGPGLSCLSCNSDKECMRCRTPANCDDRKCRQNSVCHSPGCDDGKFLCADEVCRTCCESSDCGMGLDGLRTCSSYGTCVGLAACPENLDCCGGTCGPAFPVCAVIDATPHCIECTEWEDTCSIRGPDCRCFGATHACIHEDRTPCPYLGVSDGPCVFHNDCPWDERCIEGHCASKPTCDAPAPDNACSKNLPEGECENAGGSWSCDPCPGVPLDCACACPATDGGCPCWSEFHCQGDCVFPGEENQNLEACLAIGHCSNTRISWVSGCKCVMYDPIFIDCSC